MGLKVVYDEHLKAEYQQLFNSCVVRPERVKMVDDVVAKIKRGQARYATVAAKFPGMPWWLVGLIHHMEAGCRFDRHLHNGDPLSAKTTHVPAGRPLTPGPWTWEESAEDALKLLHFDAWRDYSVPGILWKLEGFNGYGYRQYHPNVKSPYLWSFTNHYTKGKYVADGKFDANAVSQQLGIAAVMRRLV